MKKAILVTPLAKTIKRIEGALYIGVDAGALRILDNKLPLAFAVGDFDSIDNEAFSRLDCPIYRHPIQKDETDTQLAISMCVEKGITDITINGGVEGRLDHTLANLSLMIHSDLNIRFLDENQEVFMLREGVHFIDNSYQHVSFFAVEPSILTLKGFLYPLSKGIVNVNDIYTVSNSLVEERGSIQVHKGKVICVRTNYK